MNIVKPCSSLLSFKNKRLYYGTKDTGYYLTPDDTYENMWRINWPGYRSKNCYNIVNAKENMYQLYLDMFPNSAAEAQE